MFEVDLARADGVDRGGATAEGALAGFLWSRVDSLPASVTGRKIWSRHPAVIPHMEVPVWDVNVRSKFRVWIKNLFFKDILDEFPFLRSISQS